MEADRGKREDALPFLVGHTARAAFVVSEAEVPRSVQIEGTVEDLTETAVLDPLVSGLVKTVMSNASYGPPLERFDRTTMRFYRLTPDWIRWGDFTFGYGTEKVLTELDPKEP